MLHRYHSINGNSYMTYNYEHALMHRTGWFRWDVTIARSCILTQNETNHCFFRKVLTVLKIVSISFVHNLSSNTFLDLIDVVKPAGILNLMVRTGQQKSEQVPLFTTLRPNLDTINKIRSGILRWVGQRVLMMLGNYILLNGTYCIVYQEIYVWKY